MCCNEKLECTFSHIWRQIINQCEDRTAFNFRIKKIPGITITLRYELLALYPVCSTRSVQLSFPSARTHTHTYVSVSQRQLTLPSHSFTHPDLFPTCTAHSTCCNHPTTYAGSVTDSPVWGLDVAMMK